MNSKSHNKVGYTDTDPVPPLHPHIQSQYCNVESRADTLDGQLLMQMIEDESEAKVKTRHDRKFILYIYTHTFKICTYIYIQKM